MKGEMTWREQQSGSWMNWGGRFAERIQEGACVRRRNKSSDSTGREQNGTVGGALPMLPYARARTICAK